jgi:hypothetical protein
VQFPLDKPLPVAFIKRILKAQPAEHGANTRRIALRSDGRIWQWHSLAAWRMICRKTFAKPYDLIPPLWRHGRL